MPLHTEAESFTLLFRLEDPDTLVVASPTRPGRGTPEGPR